MKKNVAKKWIEALRSGKYKKTTKVLKRKNGKEESYCVLGVLCDLYKKSGKPLKENFPGMYPFEPGVVSFGNSKDWETPPQKVLNWAGVTRGYYVSEMNDGGKSFKQIANFIEKNVEGI